MDIDQQNSGEEEVITLDPCNNKVEYLDGIFAREPQEYFKKGSAL